VGRPQTSTCPFFKSDRREPKDLRFAMRAWRKRSRIMLRFLSQREKTRIVQGEAQRNSASASHPIPSVPWGRKESPQGLRLALALAVPNFFLGAEGFATAFATGISAVGK